MSEALQKTRSSKVIFGVLAGVAVGFVLGFLVANGLPGGGQSKTAQANALKDVTDPALWTDFPIEWNRLHPFAEAGKAPLTFSTPNVPYDYGAVSHPIPAELVGKALIVRVDIADVNHKVGVSLVDPKGQPLRSEEQGLSDNDKKRSIYFRVTPSALPASLLVRNYGDSSGQPGSIKVEHVYYSKENSLTSAQLQALTAMGVNKSSN